MSAATFAQVLCGTVHGTLVWNRGAGTLLWRTAPALGAVLWALHCSGSGAAADTTSALVNLLKDCHAAAAADTTMEAAYVLDADGRSRFTLDIVGRTPPSSSTGHPDALFQWRSLLSRRLPDAVFIQVHDCVTEVTRAALAGAVVQCLAALNADRQQVLLVPTAVGLGTFLRVASAAEEGEEAASDDLRAYVGPSRAH